MIFEIEKNFFRILRKLPVFRGKGRLARFAFGKFLKNQKDVIISGKQNIKYTLPNLIENIGFDIMLNGSFEQDTSDFIVSNLPKNGVFIDIGANIGAISIPVCKKRKDIQAFCVEASSKVFQYLERNINLNYINNAHLLNKAVTNITDETLNFYSPEELFGKGSRSPVYSKIAESIETISFTDLCKRQHIVKVNLVKVDVEGYEYDVFLGGKEILEKQDAPDIIFEFLKWAEEGAYSGVAVAQELLKSYGYNLYEFGPRMKLTTINKVITKDYAMIFATKKV